MKTSTCISSAPVMPAVWPQSEHIRPIKRRLPNTVDEPKNIGYIHHPVIFDEPSDELQCDPFDFTFQSFRKIYRYKEQGVIRPFMEMIDTELEPVTDKFQIYMMRYYGIQCII